MKSVLLILLWCFILSHDSPAQLIFTEEFNYPPGMFTSNSSWTVSSNNVWVVEGDLLYESYPSDFGNRKLMMSDNIDDELSSTFTPINTNTVYCSFLINISSNLNLTTSLLAGSNNYFFSFGSPSVPRGFLFIRKSSDNTINFGLGNKSSSAPEYFAADLPINITHLIVLGYSFSGGTQSLKLWINPSLNSEEEPEPDKTLPLTSVASISSIKFYQKTNTGDMFIDAIRVAASWSEAPLPVELSSFNASLKGTKIELSWITKTEVNNYGFEIERSNNKWEWECIGFVNGAGNCNSERRYNFYDDKKNSTVYYKLKQIDTDGKFSYSEIAEVKSALAGYALYQNYPNPFNPETRIQWMQMSEGEAILNVYDASGKLVRSFKESGNAGFREMVFSSNELSSGIYFYELEVGDFKARKAMVVLK